LTSLIKWVAQFTEGNTTVAGWLIVGVLVVLLVALSACVIALWPHSRQWALANRIHRLASRNEAGLRRSAERQLDCPYGGKSLTTKICSECQRQLFPDSRFCAGCGTPVT
jgi:hypothetical protein